MNIVKQKINKSKLNIPKLRFPEFKNTREWTERKLGEVAECLDNKRIPLNEYQRGKIQGSIPYYGANGILDYITDYIFNDDLVLIAEDGGDFYNFKDKPIAQKISGKLWVNNHSHILKPKQIILIDYLFYSLVHKNIIKYIVGGSRVKLNQKDLLIISIPLAPLAEQKKNNLLPFAIR